MLRMLARPLTRFAERWVPDPLVLAIMLTAIVALLALGLTDTGPVGVVSAWGDGLSDLLSFIAQVSITVLLGYTLANTDPVQRFLNRLAGLPQSPAQAYGFVTLIAAIASLISWGLGLIVGGIMALQVARSARSRRIRLHYPLLVAGAYSGFVVWHMGYSGSAPLAAATPGDFYEELGPLVPVTETIFAPWNIAVILVTIPAIVLTMVLLAPKESDTIVEFDGYHTTGDAGSTATPEEDARPTETLGFAQGAQDATGGGKTPAQRIDEARIITLIAGLAVAVYLATYFAQEGLSLTLDIVNWSFLALCLLLVRSPSQLVGIITEAGRTVGQLLLQYPLYAGILGIISTTGLVEVLSAFFVNISTPQTLGLVTFLFAGLLNIFVPSGGGQFAVQAPIFVDAAEQLGVSQPVTIMAVSYGDQWTNMIQPFFAIPLLAVAGLRIRDMLGYTAVTLLITGVIFAGTLLIVGAG